LTGLSNVNSVVDKGEKEIATTPVWGISRTPWVEVDADGSRWTLKVGVRRYFLTIGAEYDSPGGRGVGEPFAVWRVSLASYS
jgi:hypothetical protein